MVINVIGSNFEAKLIKGSELNLDLEPVFSPIIPPVYLNIYEGGNQVFSVVFFFFFFFF